MYELIEVGPEMLSTWIICGHLFAEALCCDRKLSMWRSYLRQLLADNKVSATSGSMKNGWVTVKRYTTETLLKIGVHPPNSTFILL